MAEYSQWLRSMVRRPPNLAGIPDANKGPSSPPNDRMATEKMGMDLLHVNEVSGRIADDEDSIESLRTDAFSLEVMKFERGDEDPMHSHSEDEIYHITSGSATINVEGNRTEVSPGDLIHIQPGVEHQFLDFAEELVMTVLYAPAKGSTE